MIEVKDSYTPDEVMQLLKWQHIATKNKSLVVATFRHHDDDEKVRVGVINRELIDEVMFDICDITKTGHLYTFRG